MNYLFGPPVEKINKLSSDQLEALFKNKNILIVGGTAGIGKALAIASLNRGSNVTVVGRRNPGQDLEKAKFIQKDLTLMRDASKLPNDIDLSKYDIAVFTNGIIASNERVLTKEGVEIDMAVSCLSRFAILKHFVSKKFAANRFDKKVKPRLFLMGFPGKDITVEDVDDMNSEKKYSLMNAHMNTVVANDAFVTYFAKALPNTNVYGLNPGLIKTEIRDNALGKGSWLSFITESVIGAFYPTTTTFAENTLVHLMVSPELENKTDTSFGPDLSILKRNSFLEKDNNYERIIKSIDGLLDKALGATF
ncbi:hypothetical protein HK103_001322 [Boothiomyces macroporosus]|uniref:Uncharacterized protein n=1 Tax=Boothiomyces macroporosus TaxID=261099 RepID=A0AAD5UAL1_9FUNG|nr:hypothetical protein HK103_001322 [Boothiomyces macroporosus]